MDGQVSIQGDEERRESTNTSFLSRTRNAKPDDETSESMSRNGRFGHQVRKAASVHKVGRTK